ncbi:MAG TPA: hypothetical protein ENN73_02095, partial [Firmicutes bacterium]|nr:hypothetical protein [Bacillota bacterium]
MFNISEIKLANFFTQLGTYLKSGLSYQIVFDSLIKLERNSSFKSALVQVSENISSGKTLYQSFTDSPFNKHIPQWELSLIKVGESTGDLDKIFPELVKVHEHNSNFRKRLLRGMLYPMILFHAGAIILPLAILFQGGLVNYLQNVFIILGGLWGLIGLLMSIRFLFNYFGSGEVFDSFIFRIPFNRNFVY